MIRHEHFGLIGLKIGDEITFQDSVTTVTIGSGNGTPDNGGTLVSRREEPGLISLRLLTRNLLANAWRDDLDIWKCWRYENRTLREMLDAAQTSA